MPQPLTLAPGLTSALPSAAEAGKPSQSKDALKAKARGAAQDFEAVFLNTMFSQMFTGLDPKGVFGKDSGTGIWRSFLTDEYSKSFAKAGGVGIANSVYSSLLAQQEAHVR
jgi:flagellar protein FlgJ